jgi:flagellar basal body-associated protein FliL
MAEDDQTTEDIKPGLIAKIKSDKKIMIMVGVGSLLLLLLIGGVAYYFFSGDEVKNNAETNIEGGSDSEEGLVEDDGTPNEAPQKKFEKVHMYSLKSFFFPIKLKNKKKSGHFLLATPSFSMSNAGLGGQVSKNLPTIRKKIYNILLNESYKDLTTKTDSTKELVKKRIKSKVNEILPVGTGIIKEVYFSEFIIK